MLLIQKTLFFLIPILSHLIFFFPRGYIYLLHINETHTNPWENYSHVKTWIPVYPWSKHFKTLQNTYFRNTPKHFVFYIRAQPYDFVKYRRNFFLKNFDNQKRRICTIYLDFVEGLHTILLPSWVGGHSLYKLTEVFAVSWSEFLHLIWTWHMPGLLV